MRQLCARIDLQIRRLQDGSPTLAERVMREALYYVATAPAGVDPLLDQARSVYELEGLLPPSAPVALPPAQEATLRLSVEAFASSG